MGNCTVAIKKRTGLTPTGQTVIADITLSSSYATGGDTVKISDLGMKTLSALILASTGGPRPLEVVHGAAESTDPKIKAYEDNAAAAYTQLEALGEVPAAQNVSTITVRAVAFGDLPHV